MLSAGRAGKVWTQEIRTVVTRMRIQHKVPCALNYYTLTSIIVTAYLLISSNSFIYS